MPIFFHGLDILCVNGYIIYSHTSAEHKDVDPKDIHGQKGFLKELIHSLIIRASQAQAAERERVRMIAFKYSGNKNDCSQIVSHT